MENNNLKSRREFFKEAARKALPIFGVVLLASSLVFTACTKKPDGNVTVTTSDITEITESSAKCGGSVSYTGGFIIGDCGVCFSTNSTPQVTDSHTVDRKGTGTFSSSLDNLESDTKYYVRAYANTSSGIEYGNQITFTTTYITPDPPTGAIKGLFSVSASQKVWFSKGNLQYKASSHTWRFAENQWDFVGSYSNYGTVYENGEKCDNLLASSTYNGWIDLFGWGTSGYAHGAVSYQPWSPSDDYSDYYAYGNSSYNLYDQTGKADWGYNAISNGGNTTNKWRTLTQQEWNYVIHQRNTPSGVCFAKARLAGNDGLILLPDNWSSEYYSLNDVNTDKADFSSNVITALQWTALEQNGAIFLPLAGSRVLFDFPNYVHYAGDYWSASRYDGSGTGNHLAHKFHFAKYEVCTNGHWDCDNRSTGLSVRLVRNYN